MNDLLDTNVIVRFLTADKHKKYKDLYPFFEALEKGIKRVELKLIVLFQVVFVLKSIYAVERDDIAAAMLDLLKYKGITIRERKVVQNALELWPKGNKDIVDCYLISCLKKSEKSSLFSYDKGFDRYGIKRIEP